MPSRPLLLSPRYLVHRHAQRALRRKARKDGDPPEPVLEPGQELFQSFLIPGMQAGLHTIEVQQDVSGSGQSSTLNTTQQFDVQAPRFVLPEDTIHTMYPPQGFSATAETLPHVFFNDPTFPWERVGSWEAKQSARVSEPDRNKTPWLAVFVFTEDELKLAQADLVGPSSIFRDVPGLQAGAKQDSTFTVSMAVQDLGKVIATAAPYTNIASDATVASTILLKKELFTALFSQYDGKGAIMPRSHPYVQSHRYLAHRETINTEGMAISGAVNADDTGSFGAVVSCRSGPPSITVPTPVYVHLVSIENLEQMTPWPPKVETRFVALVSLASWSYTCLPPNTPNVRDQMIALGNTLAPLRPDISQEMQEKLNGNVPIGPRLLQRLKQGYALSRYRVQTGELTSCFVRGPLVPVSKYALPDWFPKTSMVGSDLSILDRDLGLMDVSHSAAWQLGRTMAISDQSYTTCLYRVRVQIIQRATDATREAYVKQYTWHKNKETLLGDLQGAVGRLGRLPNADGLREPGSIRRRWAREQTDSLDLSYHGPIVEALVDPDFFKAAKEVASTPDPKDPTKPSDKPYDEYNAPFSADWVVVLRWVLDRLFLDSIPSHYLLPDASLVPQESLRFFMIDDNWVNSFLDGALSLGNHIDQTADKVRDAIKAAINWYLASPTSSYPYPPPIPKYGCYIRSALISKFPDLIVKAEPAPKDDQAPVLLRHEVADKGTMLCLFSQPPSPSTFNRLTMTQPPQQQSFVVGEKVTDVQLSLAYRRAYTVPDITDPNHATPIEDIICKKGEVPDKRSVLYLWDIADPASGAQGDVHMLLMDNFAPDYNTQLNAKMPPQYYSDDTATSALMAWQLSNPSYLLPISTPPGFKHGPISHQPRQLPVHKRNAPSPPTPPPSQKHRDRRSDKFPELSGRLTRKHYHPQAAPNPTGRYARLYPTPLWLTDRKNASGLRDKPEAGRNFPDFQFYFWSAEQPGKPKEQGSIPMLTDANGKPMAQDLIFSITLGTPADESWEVEWIEFRIPQGAAPPQQPKGQTQAIHHQGHGHLAAGAPATTSGPLTALYTGPGASMLSNLRFNPICTFSEQYNDLIIRLIPRTLGVDGAPGTVTADRCSELSFLLAGVKVNVSGEEVVVDLRPASKRILIKYRTYNEQVPQQFPVPMMTLEPEKQGGRS